MAIFGKRTSGSAGRDSSGRYDVTHPGSSPAQKRDAAAAARRAEAARASQPRPSNPFAPGGSTPPPPPMPPKRDSGDRTGRPTPGPRPPANPFAPGGSNPPPPPQPPKRTAPAPASKPDTKAPPAPPPMPPKPGPKPPANPFAGGAAPAAPPPKPGPRPPANPFADKGPIKIDSNTSSSSAPKLSRREQKRKDKALKNIAPLKPHDGNGSSFGETKSEAGFEESDAASSYRTAKRAEDSKKTGGVKYYNNDSFAGMSADDAIDTYKETGSLWNEDAQAHKEKRAKIKKEYG